MKKTISILLSFVMLLSVMAGLNLTANAEGFYSYYCGDFEYTEWNGGAKVLSYRGDDDEIVIPKTINNLPVLNIGFTSSSRYESVTSVKMPDTVICISYYGLSGFESLKTITFSKNLQTIERLSCCFSGFTTLTIPDSVKTIGEDAFLCCENLESITISRNIETIDKDAFYACSALKDIYFTGTKAEWEKLGITVSGATVHYGQTDPNAPNNDNEYPDETEPETNPPALNEDAENEDGDDENDEDENDEQNKDSEDEENSDNDDGNNNTNEESNLPQPEQNDSSSLSQVVNSQKGKSKIAYKRVLNKTAVIMPQATAIKKAKRNKKSITVKWKSVKGINGYQLQFATNKKFTKNKKTVNVKNSKATKKTVKKLKANKKYYVRIRTYKNVNGKRYYSKWSKTKTVKIKK